MFRSLIVIALFTFSLVLVGCQRADTESSAESASEASKDRALAAAAIRAPAEKPGKADDDHADEDYSCGGDHADKKEGACGSAEGGGCNKWDEAAAEVVKRDVPEGAVWHTLKVSGMTCGGCERRIIANVGALDGVLSVEADAELGVVRLALASEATRGSAAERIRELGYDVETN